MIFDILLTLFFVFANAFFVAAEFAIVKVRASQLELRIRNGSSLAKISAHLVKHLDAYLSATQLGITLASLGLGWIGESVVSRIIIDVMNTMGFVMTPEMAHKIALPVAFATITFLHIVFGELAPKSLAIQYSEKVTLAVTLPLRLFYMIFQPVIWVLNHFANLMVRIVGLTPPTEGEQLHSSEEIRYLLEESSKSGVIDTTEHQLLENIFEFSDTPVKQIMVPRTKISAIDDSWDVDYIIDKFSDDGYSRMPIYSGSIDNIIGEIYSKDLINLIMNRRLFIIKDIIRPAFFVSEEEKISVLLKTMQKNRVHLAVVLNEFGGTAGVVTLEDILEEIVGEIQDEYDEEAPLISETAENVYIIEAGMTIADMNEFLPVALPESDDYETLGGLITMHLGMIPEEGDSFVFENYNIYITKSSDRRIVQVKLTLIELPKDETQVDE